MNDVSWLFLLVFWIACLVAIVICISEVATDWRSEKWQSRELENEKALLDHEYALKKQGGES